MKQEIKGTVTVKMQGGETVKLNENFFVPPYFKKLMRALTLVTKEATVGDTKDQMTIKTNGAIMTLSASKGKNEIPIFYLKAKRLFPEGSSPQESKINMVAEDEVQDDRYEKENRFKKIGLP